MLSFEEINSEVLLKTIGSLLTVVVTVIGAIIQVRKKLPKMRGTLKADLEILRLLKELNPSGPTFKTVEASIDLRIQEMYSERDKFRAKKRKRNVVVQIVFLILGLLWIFGFGYWTYKLNVAKEGFAWWSLLTGYLALAGFGIISAAFEEKQSSVETKANVKETEAAAAGTEKPVASNPKQ